MAIAVVPLADMTGYIGARQKNTFAHSTTAERPGLSVRKARPWIFALYSSTF